MEKRIGHTALYGVYKRKTYAQKVALMLKNRGYPSFVRKYKGKYDVRY